MQFEATGTNGVQLNERLTGHNDATCNTAAGMRPAAIPPVGIPTMVVAASGGGRAFSRRCGLAVADQSCESQLGSDYLRSAESARSGGPAKFERQDGFKLTNLLYAYTHAYIG